MIKQVIRLIQPGLFLPCFLIEKHKKNHILVRPRYLSICAADQRYYQGNRPPEVLAKKLPIALFHEAIGEVLRDPSGELKSRTFCVLLPGGIQSLNDESNYKQGAMFRSSNSDGFCQEIMCLDRREILPILDKNIWPYLFTELMSVCCQALRKLEKVVLVKKGMKIGIWGDGSMSFMMALTLSQLKPESELYVFGKHDDKLINFSFVKQKINIADISDKTKIDIAIECVGGTGSQKAIIQAIDKLNPTGSLLLMGVSEIPPAIPTRNILEKGLIIIGSSRSTKKDFETALNLISKKTIQNSLLKIISLKKTFSNASELIDIFNEDKKSKYKTELTINL